MAAALALAARFVIRDFAEVGVNTALVALTWLAIYLWRERRDLSAGLSLGLAIALKCTPAIFVGYFLWKRQWRVAFFAATAAALFTLAPILVQGPASWWNHMTAWSTGALTVVTNDDPSMGVLGPERPQNLSLRPALARYLIHLPAGHPGRVTHPFYIDVLNLPPSVANWIIKTILLMMLGMFLWWSRRPVVTRDEPRLLWEFAAVSILMLLFSPITWGQHCVALLPACYFISALFISRGQLPRPAIGLLGFYVLVVLLLNRGFLGKDASLLLGSYHAETFAFLGLLALLFLAARRVQPQPV